LKLYCKKLKTLKHDNFYNLDSKVLFENLKVIRGC